MGGQTKNHPLTNEFLIIYVIGGITTYEMKIVKELFSKTDHKVRKLLVRTRLNQVNWAFTWVELMY